MRLQDLFGIYYVHDYRTRSYGQESMLEIMAATKDKIEFIFQTSVSGNFRSSGIIWKGNCILQDNQLSLEALEKKVGVLLPYRKTKKKMFKKYLICLILR